MWLGFLTALWSQRSHTSCMTLASKKEEAEAARSIKSYALNCTVSLVLYSIGQSSHRAFPDSREGKIHSTCWWRTGKVTLLKSMWDRRYVCSHLWEIQPATARFSSWYNFHQYFIMLPINLYLYLHMYIYLYLYYLQ